MSECRTLFFDITGATDTTCGACAQKVVYNGDAACTLFHVKGRIVPLTKAADGSFERVEECICVEKMPIALAAAQAHAVEADADEDEALRACALATEERDAARRALALAVAAMSGQCLDVPSDSPDVAQARMVRRAQVAAMDAIEAERDEAERLALAAFSWWRRERSIENMRSVARLLGVGEDIEGIGTRVDEVLRGRFDALAARAKVPA